MLQKENFIQECQLILDALIHWCAVLRVKVKIVVFCFSAFQMHFASYLFILQARLAKARKYVRARVTARKEREYPSI